MSEITSYTKNTENDHSTDPDIFTGWKKNNSLPKLKQIPLIFANLGVDQVSKSLTAYGSQNVCRVVYMGPRFVSNMRAFKSYSINNKGQQCKQANAYGLDSLKKYSFQHIYEKEKFFPIRSCQYRLFTGVNPTIQKQDLKFDSDFQCGNLDLAIYVNPVQYDLMMRVDSNTKGHTNWFFFKVTSPSTHQKIKFNILNFCKRFTFYKEGMKPYVYKKSQKEWKQDGINVQFKYKKFRYYNDEGPIMGCLSFVYDFKTADEDVYFAYCIPYSYSYLLNFISSMKEKYPHLIKVDMKNESTGGLPLPVLTITNPGEQNKKNYLCIGRLHPGQTQGSWMMDGFIRYLCSPEGHYLRSKINFKIVPMVNIDGVVLGNFRTGISGRDLNRVFHNMSDYQQIKVIRSIATKYNPQLFLDFHGHSAKRNVFLYGPNYKLEEKYYLQSRLFPKLISQKAQKFRYYSCSFKISESKMNTGRAIMLRQHKAMFSFTIEASTFCFRENLVQYPFIAKQYIDMGDKIALSLNTFLKILNILPHRLRKVQENEKKSKKSLKNKGKLKDEAKQQTELMEKISNIQSEIKMLDQLTEEQKTTLLKILQEDKPQQFEDFVEDSEKDDSDCEDPINDYTEQQLAAFIQSNGKTGDDMINRSRSNSGFDKKTKRGSKKGNKGRNKISTSLKSMNDQSPKNKKNLLEKLSRNQTNDIQSKKNKILGHKNKSSLMNHKLDLYDDIDNEDYFTIMKSQSLLNQSNAFVKEQKNKVLYGWRRGASGPKYININSLNMSPEVYDTIQLRQKKKKVQLYKKPQPQPISKMKKAALLPSINKGISSIFNEESVLSKILQQSQGKRINFKKHFKIVHN